MVSSSGSNKVVNPGDRAKRRPPAAGKGRKKGVPNKATRDVREAIARVLQANTEKFGVWLTRVAEGTRGKGKRGRVADPARALEIAMNMAEFHIPKLARTEITGAGGGPVVIKSTPVDEAL